jgi:hypothetical protein
MNMGVLQAIWRYKKVWLAPVMLIIVLLGAAALLSGENITIFRYRVF